jgi:copper chaperone CopZ
MLSIAELNVDQIDNKNQAVITKKLTDMEGVNDVKVDLNSKVVTVNYEEGKARLVDIKQAIMEDGYSVMEI